MVPPTRGINRRQQRLDDLVAQRLDSPTPIAPVMCPLLAGNQAVVDKNDATISTLGLTADGREFLEQRVRIATVHRAPRCVEVDEARVFNFAQDGSEALAGIIHHGHNSQRGQIRCGVHTELLSQVLVCNVNGDHFTRDDLPELPCSMRSLGTGLNY